MASRMTWSTDSGSMTWSAPSNIALVKYWGKRPVQLPGNASLSLTLEKSRTKVEAAWKKVDAEQAQFNFLFEGKPMPAFAKKVEVWLSQQKETFKFLNNLELTFNSSNTFPHSAGIASSASSMAAMALVIGELAREHNLKDLSEENWLKQVSCLARLGSGSASRSLYPHAATWGLHHNEWGDGVKELHPVYRDYGDAILVVDAGQKVVSSSEGHALMHEHPAKELRYKQANKRVGDLIGLLKNDDFEAFAQLVELEALDLHSLMMTSTPSFILMKPATLELISRVQKARAQGAEVCFTLDAGPNLHLLYPKRARGDAMKIVDQAKIDGLLDNQMWIDDCVGTGPRKEA